MDETKVVDMYRRMLALIEDSKDGIDALMPIVFGREVAEAFAVPSLGSNHNAPIERN